MKTSSKIRLDMMREILQLNSSTFNSKILDWALDFGFKIDGDYIIMGNADVDAFISDLDRQFENWKTKEKYHHGNFDGKEREFRGFGSVEQYDTEDFEKEN